MGRQPEQLCIAVKGWLSAMGMSSAVHDGGIAAFSRGAEQHAPAIVFILSGFPGQMAGLAYVHAGVQRALGCSTPLCVARQVKSLCTVQFGHVPRDARARWCVARCCATAYRPDNTWQWC
jgi:hypothetical protein